MEKEFFKAADIADFLGVTPGRVYQLIRTGVIPATRIAGAIRIPRGSWEAWIQKQERAATAAVSVQVGLQ